MIESFNRNSLNWYVCTEYVIFKSKQMKFPPWHTISLLQYIYGFVDTKWKIESELKIRYDGYRDNIDHWSERNTSRPSSR